MRLGSIDERACFGIMSGALTIIVEPVEEGAGAGDSRRRNVILDAQFARGVYLKRPTARPTRLDVRA
jgi:hypothetical protein